MGFSDRASEDPLAEKFSLVHNLSLAHYIKSKMADKGKQPTLSFFENFMLSGVAAGVSKTAAAPIERVKLLVQNQGEMIKQGILDKPYNGVVDCTRRTMASEGVLAFKDTIKKTFATPKDAGYVRKFGMNIVSGGCAGSMSLLFVYSLDYARTRLANDAKSAKKGGGDRQFNGLIDVYAKTLKSDGIQGLYRRFVISCVGIFIYRGMYFGLYDSLKPILLGENANVFLSFLLGWGVTITAGLMSYPIDTIRRRMMMTSGAAVKYKNSMDCAVQILKNEGFMSMMKGAGANILRGVAGAGVLAGFDAFKGIYVQWRLGQ